jgi:GMP synthase (glutamine-hydrolysing)
MTRVLALRHEASVHAGRLRAYVDLEEIDAASGDTAPEPAGALVILGGSASANDDHQAIRRGYALIDEGLRRGIPLLGLCLGAQMIARALGAEVYANPVEEIGWHPVWWTPEAASDPLLAGLAQPEWVFHWHRETFGLPHGAVRLATSEACALQAFCYGDDVYAFQFHLEATPGMIAAWMEEDGRGGAIDPAAHSAGMDRIAATVFGRWAKLVGCSRP